MAATPIASVTIHYRRGLGQAVKLLAVIWQTAGPGPAADRGRGATAPRLPGPASRWAGGRAARERVRASPPGTAPPPRRATRRDAGRDGYRPRRGRGAGRGGARPFGIIRSVYTYRQPGTVLTDHHFSVPLDHGKPDGERIELFGREVVAAGKAGDERLPWLVFLQGGPGVRRAAPGRAVGVAGPGPRRLPGAAARPAGHRALDAAHRAVPGAPRDAGRPGRSTSRGSARTPSCSTASWSGATWAARTGSGRYSGSRSAASARSATCRSRRTASATR